MQWFHRRFRVAATARVAITVVATPLASHGQPPSEEAWCSTFRMLDARAVPATWAVVAGGERWPLAGELVASCVSHELAFDDGHGELRQLVPAFLQQAELARRVQLQLSTLVSTAGGAHPSLLHRLGVAAVVPANPRSPSPTGSLRAVAWGIWEAPVTDQSVIGHSSPMSGQQLLQRLEDVLRESTRMHLLVRLQDKPTAAAAGLERFFDRVADYRSRGWLKVETVGAAAAQWTRDATRLAA